MTTTDLDATSLAMTARGLWTAERAGQPVGRIERLNRRYVVFGQSGRKVGKYWEFGQAARALDRHIDHVIRHGVLLAIAGGMGIAAVGIGLYAVIVVHLF